MFYAQFGRRGSIHNNLLLAFSIIDGLSGVRDRIPRQRPIHVEMKALTYSYENSLPQSTGGDKVNTKRLGSE